MKLEPLRSLQSKLSIAFLAAATFVLASCGGGGATSSPTTAGQLALQPGASTIYAGVPYTFTIVGGRKPYLVTSSEQTLIALNFTTEDNQFSIVANNPGVINVGLDPNEVPRRSVIIQVRDSTGVQISNSYDVLRNFFTGYVSSVTGMPGIGGTCGGGATAPSACSGTDSLIGVTPVSQGVLYGNRELQFDKVRGDYSFVVENPNVNPQLVNQIRVRTDQTGRAFVRIRVTVDAPTQVATYKVTDVTSGVTMNATFGILQQDPIDAITFLPSSSITLTGANVTQCGSGTTDLFVYGGRPPYRIETTNGTIASPNPLSSSGGRLTVSVPANAPFCGDSIVVLTDTVGRKGVINVKTSVGTQTIPPITVAPAAIATLGCGQSSQVTVIGGTGFYSVNSTHPRISGSASGNTINVSRLTGDGTVAYPLTGILTVTDGGSIATITVTATPANCP